MSSQENTIIPITVQEDIVEENDFLNNHEDIIQLPIVYYIEHELEDLLNSFNLIEVKPYLMKARITFESLKYLSREDIKEAIPPIGLRACFREKLFSWKKSQYGIDDDNLPATVGNKVVSWLKKNTDLELTSTPTSSTYSTGRNLKLSKSLKLILKDSNKGKDITTYYKKHSGLTDLHRADLINIILEGIFSHEEKLSTKDVAVIVEEIIDNFSLILN